MSRDGIVRVGEEVESEKLEELEFKSDLFVRQEKNLIADCLDMVARERPMLDDLLEHHYWTIPDDDLPEEEEIDVCGNETFCRDENVLYFI